MADDRAAVTGSACPWCSALLPKGGAETCPRCGAQLVPDVDAQVPGVTTIDAEAIVRAAHQPIPQRRSRFLSWISGEYDPGNDEPAPVGSIAPPDPDVRREMLRLELEAEVANLQAEAGLVMSEAQAEARATAPEADAADPAATPDAPAAGAPDEPDAAVPDRA